MSENTDAGAVIAYRADIDGLRAIAVLAVVLFHIDQHLLPGGFAGVDIFFVISGFLITGIIYKGREKGAFSFAEFYRRRIKRIVPVLFCVLLTTLIAGNFILLPEDFIRLAESAVAAQFFAANVYFTYFLDTSYFAADASMEPLLHLWSLGVEEQFYLIWPSVFIALCLLKAKWLRVSIISVCIVLSFGFAQWALGEHAMFAYYMLPSRAGQLLFGALCFLIANSDKFRIPRAFNELVAVIGMLAIMFSLFFIREDMGFPGINAIPVTLGSGLVILTASFHNTLVARALSLRLLVLTGLISYSMYLWHWPILAYLKYAFSVLTWQLMIASFIVIVLFSIASYRLVEVPFKRSKKSLNQVFWRQFVVPSLLICFIAVGVRSTDGYGTYALDNQYRQQLEGMDEGAKAGHRYPWICQNYELNESLLTNPRCRINSEKEPKALLWGDSNGSHYVGVLGEIAQQIGVSFRTVAHSSCPPLLESPENFVSAKLKLGCAASNKVVVEHLDDYDVVMLSGAWNTYLATEATAFEHELLSTATSLKAMGKSVVLIGRVPIIQNLDRDCTRKGLKLTAMDCSSRLASRRSQVETTNEVISRVAMQSGAQYFDVSGLLCDEQMCTAVFNNKVAYHDSGHLGMSGSIEIGAEARKSEPVLDIFRKAFAESGAHELTPSSSLPWEEYQFGSNVFSRLAEFNITQLPVSDIALETGSWTTAARFRNSMESAKQDIKLSDDSPDANFSFEIDLMKITGQSFPELGESDYLIVDIDFQALDSNNPLFRFQGDSSCAFCSDIVVNPNDEMTFQRKHQVLVSSELEDKGGQMRLRVALWSAFIHDELRLKVFPAAAGSEGAYSKAFTGSLSIQGLGLSVLNEKP